MQHKRDTFRIVGLVLWRGGLAFAGMAAIYYGAWQTIKNLVWPAPVKVAAALAMTGAALVAGFAVGVSPNLRRSLRKLVDG